MKRLVALLAAAVMVCGMGFTVAWADRSAESAAAAPYVEEGTRDVGAEAGLDGGETDPTPDVEITATGSAGVTKEATFFAGDDLVIKLTNGTAEDRIFAISVNKTDVAKLKNTEESLELTAGQSGLIVVNGVKAGAAKVAMKSEASGKETLNAAVNLTVSNRSMDDATIVVSSLTYTGDPLTPSFNVFYTKDGEEKWLKAGVDFTLRYENNVNAATADDAVAPTVIAEGMGNYEGEARAKFTIKPADASGFVFAPIADQTYTGKALTPQPVGTFAGMDLIAGRDYTLSYADNVEVGTATITIEGRGNYTGTTTCTFEIVQGGTPEPGDEPVTEIMGANRYETSALIAQAAYPNGAESVIVTTGESFPDALGASSLAGMLDCPIVLTESSELRDEAADCIEQLGSTDVLIIGGTEAVTSEVEADLFSLKGVEVVDRIEGKNRYATADEVYEKLCEMGECSQTAIIATGEDFADALSISGFSFTEKAPIFLVDEDGEMTYATQRALKSGSFANAIIVGGVEAVPADVEDWAEEQGLAVERLAGSGRYDTCLEIGNYLIDKEGVQADGAVISTGENFPDSLAGGVLAAKKNTVMLLATTARTQTFKILKNAEDITNIAFLGGTEALSSNVRLAAKKAAGLLDS